MGTASSSSVAPPAAPTAKDAAAATRDEEKMSKAELAEFRLELDTRRGFVERRTIHCEEKLRKARKHYWERKREDPPKEPAVKQATAAFKYAAREYMGFMNQLQMVDMLLHTVNMVRAHREMEELSAVLDAENMYKRLMESMPSVDAIEDRVNRLRELQEEMVEIGEALAAPLASDVGLSDSQPMNVAGTDVFSADEAALLEPEAELLPDAPTAPLPAKARPPRSGPSGGADTVPREPKTPVLDDA